MNAVERAAQVLWGIHEEAADCSHQPEHVRRLFIDANAAHRFAQALADAGLLVTDEMRAVIDAEQRAQLPDSETPPEWPGSAFLAWAPSGVWYVPTFPGRAAKDGQIVYEVEPLPGGGVLLHPLRKDGSKW